MPDTKRPPAQQHLGTADLPSRGGAEGLIVEAEIPAFEGATEATAQVEVARRTVIHVAGEELVGRRASSVLRILEGRA